MKFYAALLIAIVSLMTFIPSHAQNRPDARDRSSGPEDRPKGPEVERKKAVCRGLQDVGQVWLQTYRGKICRGLTGPALTQCNLEKSSLHRSYISTYDQFIRAGCAKFPDLRFPKVTR